jgi:hypothetical protein
MAADVAIDHMDLAKAAKLLSDLDTVAAEGDLQGIQVMDRCVQPPGLHSTVN